MPKLTKDEIISTLKSVLEQQNSETVSIEQKGGWYKINGGKSMRFSELEAMLEELGNKEIKPTEPKTVTVNIAEKTTTVSKVLKCGGLLPKELWRQKLSNQHAKLPRGF